MGRNKGLEEVEDGNKEVTSPKFNHQPPPFPLTLPESRRLGLNEGPDGIVGMSPQRALGC